MKSMQNLLKRWYMSFMLTEEEVALARTMQSTILISVWMEH